jgi:hypothetical protein
MQRGKYDVQSKEEYSEWGRTILGGLILNRKQLICHGIVIQEHWLPLPTFPDVSGKFPPVDMQAPSFISPC